MYMSQYLYIKILKYERILLRAISRITIFVDVIVTNILILWQQKLLLPILRVE